MALKLDWEVTRRSALAFARLWCRHATDAEDVAQEAIIALLRHADSVRRPDDYLFVSVKRIALRLLARQRRSPAAGPTLTIATWAQPFDAALLSRALDECAQLSPRDRLVLRMTIEGYTQSEIADSLRVGRSVVAQYVARARRKVTSSSLQAKPSPSAKDERRNSCQQSTIECTLPVEMPLSSGGSKGKRTNGQR
jgi:RNA polymerase sigma factor (sigma-70 family)